MDLWIRSQNKDFLEKCNGVFIAHTDDNIWSIINSITMTKYGMYKTKERALEVLDEIQSKIATLNFQNHFIGTDFNIIESNIYQMPEK